MGLLYAESRDGLHWVKPSLGLVEFQGSTANNIQLLNTHGMGVFKDTNPSEPPKRRYKAFGMTGKHENVGGGIFSSEDGIHWSTTNEAAPVDLKNKNRWDTHHNLLWDARLGKKSGSQGDVRAVWGPYRPVSARFSAHTSS